MCIGSTVDHEGSGKSLNEFEQKLYVPDNGLCTERLSKTLKDVNCRSTKGDKDMTNQDRQETDISCIYFSGKGSD